MQAVNAHIASGKHDPAQSYLAELDRRVQDLKDRLVKMGVRAREQQKSLELLQAHQLKQHRTYLSQEVRTMDRKQQEQVRQVTWEGKHWGSGGGHAGETKGEGGGERGEERGGGNPQAGLEQSLKALRSQHAQQRLVLQATHRTALEASRQVQQQQKQQVHTFMRQDEAVVRQHLQVLQGSRHKLADWLRGKGH